jgi:UDP-glucose 4-epimerase
MLASILQCKLSLVWRGLVPLLFLLALFALYLEDLFLIRGNSSLKHSDVSKTCSVRSFQSSVESFVHHHRRKPKAVVTGAAGFIGSHIADICQRDLRMQVVAVDDLSGGKVENLMSFRSHGGLFVSGDLRNFSFVNNLFRDHGPFDYVYHIAAYAAEGLSHFIRRYNYENNLLASVHVVNACVNQSPRPKAVIFTSSIAAFGSSNGLLPLTESSPMSPEDPYGVAKYAVELDLKAAWHMFDLPFIIFRPHNVYGPRQNIADKFRNAVGIFMNQIMRSENLTIFGSGDQTRGFSYVEDVATVIASSVAFPQAFNDSYFVGSDKHYSVIELARHVIHAMSGGGKESLNIKIIHLDKRNEVEHAYASHSKLKCAFNYQPKVELVEGLKKTAEFVKRHGCANQTGYGNIEIRKNMPPSWEEYLVKIQNSDSARN